MRSFSSTSLSAPESSTCLASAGMLAKMQMVKAASRLTQPSPFCTAGCRDTRAPTFTISAHRLCSVVQALEMVLSRWARVSLGSSVLLMESKMAKNPILAPALPLSLSLLHTVAMLAPLRSSLASTQDSGLLGKDVITFRMAAMTPSSRQSSTQRFL
jgi:hypothetical protein